MRKSRENAIKTDTREAYSSTLRLLQLRTNIIIIYLPGMVLRRTSNGATSLQIRLEPTNTSCFTPIQGASKAKLFEKYNQHSSMLCQQRLACDSIEELIRRLPGFLIKNPSKRQYRGQYFINPTPPCPIFPVEWHQRLRSKTTNKGGACLQCQNRPVSGL